MAHGPTLRWQAADGTLTELLGDDAARPDRPECPQCGEIIRPDSHGVAICFGPPGPRSPVSRSVDTDVRIKRSMGRYTGRDKHPVERVTRSVSAGHSPASFRSWHIVLPSDAAQRDIDTALRAADRAAGVKSECADCRRLLTRAVRDAHRAGRAAVVIDRVALADVLPCSCGYGASTADYPDRRATGPDYCQCPDYIGADVVYRVTVGGRVAIVRPCRAHTWTADAHSRLVDELGSGRNREPTRQDAAVSRVIRSSPVGADPLYLTVRIAAALAREPWEPRPSGVPTEAIRHVAAVGHRRIYRVIDSAGTPIADATTSIDRARRVMRAAARRGMAGLTIAETTVPANTGTDVQGWSADGASMIGECADVLAPVAERMTGRDIADLMARPVRQPPKRGSGSWRAKSHADVKPLVWDVVTGQLVRPDARDAAGVMTPAEVKEHAAGQ